MNPTAEDILNKYATGWTSAQKFWKRQIIAAMEEYSLLKSKEAADKAWEAGNKFKADIESGHYAESKETFMKELFKDHG